MQSDLISRKFDFCQTPAIPIGNLRKLPIAKSNEQFPFNFQCRCTPHSNQYLYLALNLYLQNQYISNLHFFLHYRRLFFGHQLEIWFCKIKFSINSTKKFKEKQEKNELKKSDFRNYLKWRNKEHKQTTAGECGAGIFTTGQDNHSKTPKNASLLEIPCPVL